MPINGELTMPCLHCNASITCIRWTKFGDKGIMMYSGTCSLANCSKETPHQYLCKWCNDYSFNNNPPGRLGGGRPAGIYQNIRSVRQHFNSSTHRLSEPLRQTLEDNVDQTEMIIDGDENNNTNNQTIENNTVNSAESIDNQVSVTAGKRIDFVNKCGFDRESKSPAYYEFVNSNEGKGAQYLTAKAFSVDVKKVTPEEA